MDLFDYMREQNKETSGPLASRMRPTTLDEVVGQQHIVGKDKLLYRAIKADKLSSIIFYGPPGTGKTTLAKVIAHTTSAEFMQINATSAGKKDMERGLKCEELLQQKRCEFFEENKTLNRNEKQWSHRKLAILYDLLNGDIWDDYHANIAFDKNDDAESKSEIFLGQDRIWKAKRYLDSKARISLSQGWQKILEEYDVKIIDFDEKINDSEEYA